MKYNLPTKLAAQWAGEIESDWQRCALLKLIDGNIEANFTNDDLLSCIFR